MYAIVDVETTGGSPVYNRVIEVAVVLFEGNEVTGRFSSLINPDCAVPGFITALTGIRSVDLEGAPHFHEIAGKLQDILDDRVFVAHNVHFDYGFIKKEFEACGIPYRPKKLCTVRLSRRILPGLNSYSLGNICARLGIVNEQRHRALGDALATAKLFGHLLVAAPMSVADSLKRSSRESTLPPNLDRHVFDNVPEEPGVYFFHDQKGRVIYVGKAKNIRSRIAGHFSGSSGREKQLFLQKIHDLTWELCGDELIALLEESHQIKKLRPEYNAAQLQADRNYGLYMYHDQGGYQRLSLGKTRKGVAPVATFRSFQEGRSILSRICREFGLCPKFCGLQAGPSSCWDHRNGSCRGACAGRESPDDYNDRLETGLASLRLQRQDLIIVGRGRVPQEKSFVLIEQGGYRGYGFAGVDETLCRPEDFGDRLVRRDDNQDVQRILGMHLQRPGHRVIMEFSGR